MKKREKEKKRKRVFLSILMILFTGVVLTGSTYAWFTSNKTVTVNQMDVNVTAGGGLQVSTDATSWKTVISNTDITGAPTKTNYPDAVNQLPSGQIYPVSSIGEVETEATGFTSKGFMKMFLGTTSSNATGDFVLTSTADKEEHTTTKGNFIAFDLFFQINQAANLYLTSESSVSVPDGVASKGIENAARVAFVKEGHVDAGATMAEAQALNGATNADVVIWEPNNDVHTASAVKYAQDTYGKTTTAGPGAAALTYNGVKAEFSTPLALNSEDANYFAAVTPKFSTTKTNGIAPDGYLNLLSLEAGITKVRVYMWVEGQDVDCEDNASGSQLSYNLQFSTLSGVNA